MLENQTPESYINSPEEELKDDIEKVWKGIKDRCDNIYNKIIEKGEYKENDKIVSYRDNNGGLVEMKTAIKGDLYFSMTIRTPEGNPITYSLYQKDGHSYTLSVIDNFSGRGDQMKNISTEQIIQILDEFEEKLKEYDNEKFNKMRQFAQKASDEDKIEADENLAKQLESI